MSTPDPGELPYASASAAAEVFAAHVNAGKVATFRAFGLDLVMGERRGSRFRDAYDGRWLYNCDGATAPRNWTPVCSWSRCRGCFDQRCGASSSQASSLGTTMIAPWCATWP